MGRTGIPSPRLRMRTTFTRATPSHPDSTATNITDPRAPVTRENDRPGFEVDLPPGGKNDGTQRPRRKFGFVTSTQQRQKDGDSAAGRRSIWDQAKRNFDQQPTNYKRLPEDILHHPGAVRDAHQRNRARCVAGPARWGVAARRQHGPRLRWRCIALQHPSSTETPGRRARDIARSGQQPPDTKGHFTVARQAAGYFGGAFTELQEVIIPSAAAPQHGQEELMETATRVVGR